jgi:hypothetical protein
VFTYRDAAAMLRQDLNHRRKMTMFELYRRRRVRAEPCTCTCPRFESKKGNVCNIQAEQSQEPDYHIILPMPTLHTKQLVVPVVMAKLRIGYTLVDVWCVKSALQRVDLKASGGFEGLFSTLTEPKAFRSEGQVSMANTKNSEAK